MIISWGRRSVLLKDGMSHCPECGEDTPFSITLVYKVFGLFWIFLTTWSKTYICHCNECGTGWELEGEAQAEIEHIVSQIGKSPIPFLHRYGLWILLCIGIPFLIIYNHLQDKEMNEILNNPRETAAIQMIDFIEVINGEEAYALTELGVLTLQAFHNDAKRNPVYGHSEALLYPSGRRPTLRYANRVAQFMIKKDGSEQQYVNEEGLEVLLLYMASNFIMDESQREKFAEMSNWPPTKWNSSDCFYIYDNHLKDN